MHTSSSRSNLRGRLARANRLAAFVVLLFVANGGHRPASAQGRSDWGDVHGHTSHSSYDYMRITQRDADEHGNPAHAWSSPIGVRPKLADNTHETAGSEPQAPDTVLVRNVAELRQAVGQAKPGVRIRLAAGEYPGGFYFPNLRGEPGRPIVIAAADPTHPPVIRGGPEGLNLAHAAYVEVEQLVVRDAQHNGLNISDGGSFDRPAHHIVLRGLRVTDVGKDGNEDGIKLSGVDDFRVEGCTVERWGIGGGSAIDMVGCHRGVIAESVFRHHESTVEQPCNGVQAKGGCSQIAVRKNRFEHAGHIAMNLGGSTNPQVFRPPLKSWPGPHYEAKDVLVEGNVFIGAGAPVAFVGVEGGVVRFNTIYGPRHWALRILHGENVAPDFVLSRNGRFTDNLVAFRSDQWWDGGVNISSRTAPKTFAFARNFWYCVDKPLASRPTLPTAEVDGVYGTSPQFRDASTGDLRLQPGSPACQVGAEALPREK